MNEIAVQLALLEGLSKENRQLRQELRNAHEVLAALCFQAAAQPLRVKQISFLHTDATLSVEYTLEGDWLISVTRPIKT